MALSFIVYVSGGRPCLARKSSISKELGLKTAFTVAGNRHLRVKKKTQGFTNITSRNTF
jgi:hypothetical protein